MGRKRSSNPLDLPPRLYWHHGAFWYRHRTGKAERLGTDVVAAKDRARHYNDPDSTFGTVAWYFDEFLRDFERKVAAGAKAQRTLDDYRDAAEPLKAFFGKMAPANVRPHHVARYLDIGLEAGRSVRANRERAALSGMFTFLVRHGHGGVTVNPCRGVRRNPETPRERYVDDAEYSKVLASVPAPVRAAMQLAYLTLQRPADILGWTRANIQTRTVKGAQIRVLAVRQGKTGRAVDIEVTGALAGVLDPLVAAAGLRTLVHTIRGKERGKRYTEDGLAATLHRHQLKVLGKGHSFGLQDLKAKGATDMYLAGVPLERIQILCGHDSVTTTEVYVKRHMQRIATPNLVKNAG